MCTAITYKAQDFYFGRTLDVEFDIEPSVIITPRKFVLQFSGGKSYLSHYAIIGMAIEIMDYPLYFDATNEKGLSMAGLNFPDNAYFFDEIEGKNNVSASEIIPYILGKCQSVDEAILELKNINITRKGAVSEKNAVQLHWIISDSIKSITVEQMVDGLHVYDNPVGVLTNNPPFNWQMINLNNYLNLTSDEPTNRLKNIKAEPYCKGMGAIGLPGDLSSASRFIRVAFTKAHANTFDSEEKNVEQFFNVLGSVFQTIGCVKAGKAYERTLYTSCCNTTKGIYYYKTYFNSQINAINLHNTNIDDNKLITYKLNIKPTINNQN